MFISVMIYGLFLLFVISTGAHFILHKRVDWSEGRNPMACGVHENNLKGLTKHQKPNCHGISRYASSIIIK